jgi:hypothetical protein
VSRGGRSGADDNRALSTATHWGVGLMSHWSLPRSVKGSEDEVPTLPHFQPHVQILTQSVSLALSDKSPTEINGFIGVAGFNVFRHDDPAILI